MIRIIAKLFAVIVALAAFLPVAPLFAAPVVWISSTGTGGSPCAATNPCATIAGAAIFLDSGGQINCLDSPRTTGTLDVNGTNSTIDCAGVWQTTSGAIALSLVGSQIIKIRNLTFSGATGGLSAIKVIGSGTLIIENCVFENFTGTALDFEPNGPLNLVITNSRISNNGAGIVIKPSAAVGRVTAALNGVTIADNTGGGLKTDSTIGGLIEVDVSNSTISNNAGNGMNAVGGAGGSNILNVGHSVIATNGSAGIQANGANAAVLVDTTLLDLNINGMSIINGGKVFTYGNNRIIGNPGAGFSGPAALQ